MSKIQHSVVLKNKIGFLPRKLMFWKCTLSVYNPIIIHIRTNVKYLLASRSLSSLKCLYFIRTTIVLNFRFFRCNYNLRTFIHIAVTMGARTPLLLGSCYYLYCCILTLTYNVSTSSHVHGI
jgi:hypothetical protein